MAKVIITHIRNDTSKPWIIVNEETTHNDMFTDQEIDILIFTKSAISSIPGYISSTESFADNNTYIIEMNFDTLANAQSAKQLLDNPPENSKLALRHAFLKNKRITLAGEPYTVSISVIE